MQLNLPSLLTLSLALLAPSPTTAKATSTTTTTKLTLRIPPSQPLPNPHTLPSSTRATLSTLGTILSAPLSSDNGFVFQNLSAGSYLAEVHCRTHGFVPMRVDVLAPADGDDKDSNGWEVKVWETFRGNEWGNTGERFNVEGDERGFVVDVKVTGQKGYYMERPKFLPMMLSIFKSPVVLLGLVSMLMFSGMPKLVENMDPEMRAEWEQRQKENPMNALMGAAQGENPMANFDMAAFLAGSSKKKQDNGKGDNKKKR